MTEEENKTDTTKSLSDLLGMNFKEDGSWSAKDIGNTPINQKTNRKQRRIAKSILRKAKKVK